MIKILFLPLWYKRLDKAQVPRKPVAMLQAVEWHYQNSHPKPFLLTRVKGCGLGVNTVYNSVCLKAPPKLPIPPLASRR